MRRRSRLLRGAKWGGVAVCVLLIPMWGMSLRWDACFVGTGFVVQLDSGVLSFGSGTRPSYRPGSFTFTAPPGFHIIEKRRSKKWGFVMPRFRRVIGNSPGPMMFLQTSSGMPVYWARWLVRVPLWLPLTILFGLWSFRSLLSYRRPLPGHCPCGYDLTGNVSGVCPECGRITSPAA